VLVTGLKIVLVEFSPSGGLFQFAVQLGEALADRGHDVELVTGPRPELLSRRPGFRVSPGLPTWHASEGAGDHRLKRRARRALRAVRYHLAWVVLLRHLRRERPDVVQFSGGRFPIDGIMLAWLAHRSRPSRPLLVVLAHSPLPLNEQRDNGQVLQGNRIVNATLGLGYRSADALMVLGEQSAADLRSMWPDMGVIDTVPHGDEGVFLHEPPTPAGDTDPVVLFFGTLQAYKGIDLLLAAFERVRDRHPEARLVIAGAPSADTNLEEIRGAAERIGRVELRPGYVPMGDVAGLFREARVVVAPYRYANASGVVELAHTFARPVVATRVGDLPAVVEHEHSGLLVPPNDPGALADALARLLHRPDEAQLMGAAGCARSVEGASWSTVAERIEAVYRRCLVQGRPSCENRAAAA
jgi:glycosyltransferase involved in cell wall biosynthesis